MKCPHCLVEFHPTCKNTLIGDDKDGQWGTILFKCPNPSCSKAIIFLVSARSFSPGNYGWNVSILGEKSRFMAYPKGISRAPMPIEVPDEYAKIYNQACLTLLDSPMASAALSRRCLQNILRETAKVKNSDLSKEIQELIDSGKLPSHISESIDAVRNIGNFAAHPIKSKSSGEIVEVEQGEAEWNLDVLEMLFDFYFVQPEIIRKKKEALNEKLKDAGKAEMK